MIRNQPTASRINLGACHSDVDGACGSTDAATACHGIGSRGTKLLRAYQLEGSTQRELLFDVAKIRGLTLRVERFDKPGPNYQRNDSAMQEIFCRL